jgi:heme exporter protein A
MLLSYHAWLSPTYPLCSCRFIARKADTGILSKLLKWQNIGKVYGRRRLFENLSGEINRGAGLVVTGANGSGKSTLMKIFAGLVRPDSGSVERQCLQSEIGYSAPDQLFYSELTALENIAYVADIRGLKLSSTVLLSYLDSVGLSKSAHKQVGAFSTGMIQRLRIATALSVGTSLVLLDEPTIGLDTSGLEMVEALIQNSNSTDTTKACAACVIATNEPAQAARFAALGWETIHVGE